MEGEGDSSSTSNNVNMTEEPRNTKVADGMDYKPAPGAYDVTPSWDGRVWKEVLKEGQGFECPAEGSRVHVHYIGTLPDGTEFDRSDRNRAPFSFTLGKKEVIGGWDIGVGSMKKGEVAKLIIHPDLGYGERGSGKIPSNATLIFEVELINWTYETLTDDGGVTRKVLKAGQLKYHHPNDGAECKIYLEGYCDGKKFEERVVEFIHGEGSEVNLIKGIEVALEKFSEFEKSELIIQPNYAYGEEGNSELGIPPNAELKYIVELLKFTKGKEAWSLDGIQKMECARDFKAKGTKFFQDKKYKLAHRNYKKVVDFLKMEAPVLEGDIEEERKWLLATSHLNQAQCCLELEDFLGAKHAAEEALEIQPKNVKGWFRKGMANMGLKEPVAAKIDFTKVVELDPTNKLAQHKIQVCNKMIKEHSQKEKNLYAKMIGAI